MYNKSILIFGAGIYQISLIRAAKDLGCTVISIDPDENAPAKRFSDFFYKVEGKDYQTTKEITIKHKVDGFVTGQMEKPLMLMAQLAHELSIPFMSQDVIKRSQNKWLMKKVFIEQNVPCAKGELLDYSEDIERYGLQYPVIIKPIDSSSSRGVFKILNRNDFDKCIEKTKSYSSNGKVIVEEFIEGKEYSVEAITYDGVTTIIQITEKFITPFPHTVEIGHIQPVEITNNDWQLISKLVESAIHAIGIDNSASHAEVMVTANGSKMIEIAARLGGDFISSYLTEASTGISMDKAAVQVALGFKPDLKGKKHGYSYIKYLELPVGAKVARIEPFNDILSIPGVVFVHVFVKQGDIIQSITNSADRPACFIVEGNSRNTVFELGKLIEDQLKHKIILKS
jgi:carbamoyl-phosphate synthase large subunit